MELQQDTVHLDRHDLSADHVENTWAKLVEAAQEHAQSGLVRTHTQTLVILTRAARPKPAAEAIAVRRPGRYVTVAVGSNPRRTAEVSLVRRSGQAAASELVELPVPARDASYWAEAVLPLLRADMPVAALVSDLDLVESDDFLQLAENLDIAILDTRSVSHPVQPWARLLAAEPDLTPMDLAWTALQPWRAVTAAAFDPDELWRLLPSLAAVKAVGGPLADSSAIWFHGWLADRIPWEAGEPTLTFTGRRSKGGLRAIDLAFAGDQACRIRREGRQLRAEVEVNGRVVHATHQPWSDPDWADLLALCLGEGYDAVFKSTLENLLARSDGNGEAGADA